MKRKDPTKTVLLCGALLYLIAAIGRWFFLLNPVTNTRDANISGVGVAGVLLASTVCLSLLLQSQNIKARLFWGIIAVNLPLGLLWRVLVITDHTSLFGAIQATIMAGIFSIFLIIHKKHPYCLFSEKWNGRTKMQNQRMHSIADSAG